MYYYVWECLLFLLNQKCKALLPHFRVEILRRVYATIKHTHSSCLLMSKLNDVLQNRLCTQVHTGRKLGGGCTGGWIRVVKTGLIFPRGRVNHQGWFRLVLAGLGWFSPFPSFCMCSRCIWSAKIAKNLTIKARKHFQCNATVSQSRVQTREVSLITVTGYLYLPDRCMLLLQSSAAQSGRVTQYLKEIDGNKQKSTFLLQYF